jgi:hypothetical protein
MYSFYIKIKANELPILNNFYKKNLNIYPNYTCHPNYFGML